MARETRASWAARVERWQRSGLDVATFARRERCNPRTLTYWRWRLGKTAASGSSRRKPSPTVSFVEVVAAPSAGAVEVPVEVVLSRRLPGSAALPTSRSALLQTVLTVLEAPR